MTETIPYPSSGDEDDPRWYVELNDERRTVEDVGATEMSVHPSGTLLFSHDEGFIIAYAPGTWRTVTR